MGVQSTHMMTALEFINKKKKKIKQKHEPYDCKEMKEKDKHDTIL